MSDATEPAARRGRPASAVTVAQLDEFDEIIDVRSEGEFAEDHIPGAINLPVLNKAGAYLQQAIEKGSNDWTRGFSLAICQSLLTPVAAQPQEAAWVAERRRIDREYSARARDFELRQRAWQQERAALLEQGIDADYARATALARNLTAPEAARRLAEQGPNRLPEVRARGPLVRFSSRPRP
jgi:hypothetical protein